MEEQNHGRQLPRQIISRVMQTQQLKKSDLMQLDDVLDIDEDKEKYFISEVGHHAINELRNKGLINGFLQYQLMHQPKE